MEGACSCNNKNAIQKMEAELAGCSTSVKRQYSEEEDVGNKLDYSEAMNIVAGYRARFGKNPRYAKNSMTDQSGRRALKRRHVELEPKEDADDAMHDDDCSNSSITTVSSSSDNIFVEKSQHVDTCSSDEPMQVVEEDDDESACSYILLSFVENGWQYEQVKAFLLEEYKVVCVRITHAERWVMKRADLEDDFQALIRIETQSKYKAMFIDLIKRHFYEKFMFYSLGKLPEDLDEVCGMDCERFGPQGLYMDQDRI